MKKIFSLSLMIVFSSIILSCSGDSNSSDTPQTQDLTTTVDFETVYEPTPGQPTTYVQTGSSSKTTLLDLGSSDSSLRLQLVDNLSVSELVEVSTDGRKIQSKLDIDNSNVGDYTLSYKVVQTGTSYVSDTSTLDFRVYYGENSYIPVTVSRFQYLTNQTELSSSPLSNDNGISFEVPYQYIVDDNMVFILCVNGESSFGNAFQDVANTSQWRVVKITPTITNYILPGDVFYRNVHSKSHYSNQTELTRTFIELRLNWNNTDGYSFDDIDDGNGFNRCDDGNTYGGTTATTFDCTTI